MSILSFRESTREQIHPLQQGAGSHLVLLDHQSPVHHGFLAFEHGRGGIEYMRQVTGLSRTTIRHGRDELVASTRGKRMWQAHVASELSVLCVLGLKAVAATPPKEMAEAACGTKGIVTR